MSDGSARPLPPVTAESKVYWAAGLDGTLLVGTCNECSTLHHPPQMVCPRCWSAQVGTVTAKGTGTVEAVSVVHRNATPEFRDMLPYVVAYIALDEGPRMTASVVGCNPDQVTVGQRVRAVFEQLSDDIAVPLFEPLES